MMNYSISDQGLALVKAQEGFQAEPLELAAGGWVVGYGHVREFEAGETVSELDAEALLACDLEEVEAAVNEYVTGEINQAQYDALVSFAMSIGVVAFRRSDVLRRVNKGDFVAAACAMDAWRRAEIDGELEIVEELVARRAAEKALFLSGVKRKVSASAAVRPKLDHAASILGAPVKAASPKVEKIEAPAIVIEAPTFEEPAVEEVVIAEQVEPAARITEILMSEPATEALLLTDVVPEFIEHADDEDDFEINTANAKPRARDVSKQASLPALLKAEKKFEREAIQFEDKEPSFFDNYGSFAMVLGGAAMLTIGAALYVTGIGDMIAGTLGTVLALPGLAMIVVAARNLFNAPNLHVA